MKISKLKTELEIETDKRKYIFEFFDGKVPHNKSP